MLIRALRLQLHGCPAAGLWITGLWNRGDLIVVFPERLITRPYP